ncbi:peptidoglycan-binding domain-containing protein [Clostridium ganghwense]|uniref:Peptidoglycan-binding domain-containing protein n=1 Tax=Clostridium ganghwense TaxID=312089 RepID=A0ABT4CM62_9CLOT|nr:peptidoglycan-binding domain-containing protein [Clostridium ganghwense]MCY6370023.1 peptidoglycan-binding domain-containing protein [Clostridium ganghwense]
MAQKGRLQVQTLVEDTYVPIPDVTIIVKHKETDESRQKEQVITTDSSGQTSQLELDAPPIDNSMKPSDKLPYSLCDVEVKAKGYRDIVINGCQIYPDTLAVQTCRLKPISPTRQVNEKEIINIAPNKLVGKYLPKIPEDPNKPLPEPTGGVVLPEPVVPELIVVHAGVPDDPSAPNYTLRYKDYVKNVASCEIFSTWPESTIRANVYCIISFTLNRIYTEWYRGKGKNFDITSSTAFDHAFSYGRNIYSNISRVVDNIFSTYMKRPGKKQPLLSQYCDGEKVKCPGWLTQWGSKFLGDAGKVPYEILTNFYGTDLELTTAKKVSGIPMSYPGYTLKLGSSGEPVRTVQKYLNRISDNYPAIPKVIVDGIYGDATKKSVTTFQKIFYLPPTGAVNYTTWYKISDIYVAVTGIAELRSTDIKNGILQRGDKRIIKCKKEGIFIPPPPYTSVYIPKIKYPLD